MSISLDFYYLSFFGTGSYVVAVNFVQNYACIASINGTNIALNFNY